MRILAVGLYREQSGYAQAGRETILALDEAGAEVACRPIQLTANAVTEHPRLRELEQRNFPGGCDVLICHSPPYYFQTQRRCGLNVGMFYAETDPVPSCWTTRANLMDVNVVPCRAMADVLSRSPHCRRPVEVVGIPCDPARYAKQYEPPPQVAAFKRDGKFLFYTIGEWVRRKNAAGLLRAYFAEFSSGEPVGLVIKTGVGGKGADEAARMVAAEVDSIQKGTKLRRVPPVMVVTERLTDDELCGLHQACDVFVQPSYAESFSIPAFDALAFGKTPIVTAAGGYLDYVDESTGWLIPARREPVFSEGNVHHELFTGDQAWWAPDLVELRGAMRQAYEDAASRKEMAANRTAVVERYSRATVGRHLLKVLQKHGQAFASVPGF